MANSVLCVGEILWDNLPAGRFLGGAPYNVAAHLARLGHVATLVTRVGRDVPGDEALRRAAAAGIALPHVQRDDHWPTGEALAEIDAGGSARYRFTEPAAWDRIGVDDAVAAAVPGVQAVVFGTLAQRSAISRESIARLVDAASWRVFDANLRAPHVDQAVTLQSMVRADLIKLNEPECAIVGEWLGCGPAPDELRAAIEGIRRAGRPGAPPLELCITLGERGAACYSAGHWHRATATPVVVADTVGTGDSFLAMLVSQRLRGADPATALRKATELAAFVASRPGAVPEYDARRFC